MRGAAVEGDGAADAAVSPESGSIFGGCSISEADLPPASLCAETTAIGHACAQGVRTVDRLVIVGPAPDGAPPPCGRCLQLLLEFGSAVEIRWGSPEREFGRARIEQLLPHAFLDYRDPPGCKEGLQ
jgi:cytidine deaminase